MVLPLPQFQSLGQMIADRLEQGNRNALLGEELKSRRFENELAPQRNKMQMQKMEQENQLFPLELQKQELNNKLLAEELENYKPKNETERAYKNALIQKMNFQKQNPLYGQPGIAGQIGAAQVSDPETAKTIMNALQTNLAGRQSQAALQNKQTQGYEWNQLTADTQNNLIAQGRGMGIDPTQMKNYISQGLNIRQIAEKEGLDPNNIPPPVYFPTETTKTRVQQQQQVGAEIDYMSSAITPIIAKYADTFYGVSPKKIKDMLSSNPEAQKRYGEYVGALALQNELANGRVLLSGGKSGIEIIRDLKDKTLAGIDTYSPIKMNSTSYKSAQDFMDRTLQRGAKIRTMTGMDPFSSMPKTESKEENKYSKENDPLGIR